MLQMASAFQIDGKPVIYERYGSGHINRTYLIITDASRRYILQSVNTKVFTDVPALMRNIAAVTGHLRRKGLSSREVPTLVPAVSGGDYIVNGDGECWRMFEYVDGSLCLDRAESAEDFRQSALAFGRFQNLLADFPAETLAETIPHFHDTPARYAALRAAAEADVMGRAELVRRELDFALARERDAGAMLDMLGRGELPIRVTHNDTKLNNVMLDAVTRKALCVIDLDTVMPGLVANDFGDSIRFGASTALEDEPDISKVSLSLPLYEVYTESFLEACGERLTAREIKTLPMGARLMTLECGVRFLADYLAGDVYFTVNRPGHNLDRCRTQFRLVEDMERNWSAMERAVTA